MKVYLFDVTSGLYEGEDFVDPKEVRADEGITQLAPPAGEQGQLPVYDRDLDNWKLVPIASLKESEKGND